MESAPKVLTQVNKKTILFLLIAAGAVCVAAFYPYIFGNRYLAFRDVGNDTLQQYLSQYASVIGKLRRGDFSLWDANNGFGVNLFLYNLTNPVLMVLYLIGFLFGNEALLPCLVYVLIGEIMGSAVCAYLYLSVFHLDEKAKAAASFMKKTLFEEVGGLDDRFDGAQDYDLILRAAEKAEKIVHIPKVLYHWRTHEASTADNPMSKVYAYEAGKKAIEDSLKRLGFSGTAEILKDYGFYRVHYRLTSEPLISVIIPNRDHADILKKCLDALRNVSYKKIEIIIVENGSTEEETRRFYEELKKEGNVRIAVYDGGFNYSAINNLGVRSAAGEYLLFLNNDVYGTISPDWISEMLSVCERPDVGAVGAKLYYPDDTVQHDQASGPAGPDRLGADSRIPGRYLDPQENRLRSVLY